MAENSSYYEDAIDIGGNSEMNSAPEFLPSDRPLTTTESVVLLISVLIVGFCTILYELLIGSVSSYFLGDSVKQFSIVIGLTMTGLGLGSLLSRLFHQRLIYWFVIIEIALAIVGGLSVPILYYVYLIKWAYYSVMCILILSIGALIGLEIPLLTRVMESRCQLKDNISNVLSLDYLGAFLATFAFPFVLLPLCGLFNTSALAGLMNLVVGVLNYWQFRKLDSFSRPARLTTGAALTFVLLMGTLVFSAELKRNWENLIFQDKVILSVESPYQRIVLTRKNADLRMFIDGNVQFSSVDEHRYHELLIHIPMSLAPHRESILVLGGGDGLALREIFKYQDVKEVTLVDLDKAITDLAKDNPLLRDLNGGSMSDKRVNIINDDAYKYIETTEKTFDLIVIDLPDPNNASLARMYSWEFYRRVRSRLNRTGIVVAQATSPFFSPNAFWCIQESLKKAGFPNTYLYHGYVPSFGDWGFALTANIPYDIKTIRIDVPTKYLDNQTAQKAFVLEKDVIRENILPSSLDRPEILQYYISDWEKWGL